MKILIEEKDETQTYRVVPIDQLLEMVKLSNDKIEIYVPNLCGGESRITVYRSETPNGNEKNLKLLKAIKK
jgi:hypothetical protein